MEEMAFDKLEIAPPAVVLQAAQDFAAALAETPQFKAFEKAAWRLQQDQEAEKARKAFLIKQDSLKAQIRLNAVPLKEQVELESLRMEYLALAPVLAYQRAEASLRTLCQMLAGQLSRQIGLDFAAATSTGCCS
jgi:cell fate (sporulation/competence/biofilm development) regulator YlbF (YheA/YmcA/DUF963 family)